MPPSLRLNRKESDTQALLALSRRSRSNTLVPTLIAFSVLLPSPAKATTHDFPFEDEVDEEEDRIDENCTESAASGWNCYPIEPVVGYDDVNTTKPLAPMSWNEWDRILGDGGDINVDGFLQLQVLDTYGDRTAVLFFYAFCSPIAPNPMETGA